MGVDLLSPNRPTICRSWFGWEHYLDMAILGGWEPAGTQLPDDENWAGGYCSNDGQRVLAGDAREMAKAIRKTFNMKQRSGIDLDVPTGRFEEAAKELAYHHRMEVVDPKKFLRFMNNMFVSHFTVYAPARRSSNQAIASVDESLEMPATLEEFLDFLDDGDFHIW